MNKNDLMYYANILFYTLPIFAYNVFIVFIAREISQDDRFSKKDQEKYLIYLALFTTAVVIFFFHDAIFKFD